MKQYFIIVISLVFIVTNLKSQSIRVTYEEKMKLSMQTNDPQIAASMDIQFSNMKKNMYLYYNKGESIYESSTKEDKEQSATQSGMTMIIISEDVVVYKNQKTKEIVSQEYIFDRKFRIADTLFNFKWILSNEEKIINNFKCHKATDTTGITTAWYCTDIPINDGPYIFWGLPGLIIELSHENKIVTALEVLQIEESETQIKKPSDGTVVGRNEFNSIFQKKIKELGGNQQGGVQIEFDIQK